MRQSTEERSVAPCCHIQLPHVSFTRKKTPIISITNVNVKMPIVSTHSCRLARSLPSLVEDATKTGFFFSEHLIYPLLFECKENFQKYTGEKFAYPAFNDIFFI